jgi:hypothetical protein
VVGGAAGCSTGAAAEQAHVERWREVGGPWRPYDGPVPVAAMREAALGHPDAKVRRAALEVLDHEANDESIDVFRAALADPAPRVRLLAPRADLRPVPGGRGVRH